MTRFILAASLAFGLASGACAQDRWRYAPDGAPSLCDVPGNCGVLGQYNHDYLGGRLMNDQQLSDARADLARAQIKYDHIQAIIANMQAIFANREVSATGRNHDQILNAERQMRIYENMIFEELGRIAESYRFDLEVARGRVQSLNGSLLIQ